MEPCSQHCGPRSTQKESFCWSCARGSWTQTDRFRWSRARKPGTQTDLAGAVLADRGPKAVSPSWRCARDTWTKTGREGKSSAPGAVQENALSGWQGRDDGDGPTNSTTHEQVAVSGVF